MDAWKNEKFKRNYGGAVSVDHLMKCKRFSSTWKGGSYSSSEIWTPHGPKKPILSAFNSLISSHLIYSKCWSKSSLQLPCSISSFVCAANELLALFYLLLYTFTDLCDISLEKQHLHFLLIFLNPTVACSATRSTAFEVCKFCHQNACLRCSQNRMRPRTSVFYQASIGWITKKWRV